MDDKKWDGVIKLTAVLTNEIIQYCELNEINNIENFVNKILRSGFTMEKYGTIPTSEYIVIDKPRNNGLTEIKTIDEMMVDEKNKKDLYNE